MEVTACREERSNSSLEWLYSTQLFGIKLGLENVAKLLSYFDALPNRDQVKVVQVAGTNGKGSTSAMMESVARHSGWTTGLFTSPHLVCFTERIRVGGEKIPKDRLYALLDFVKEKLSGWKNHPTFFEISLLVSLLYFKEKECDFILLEVGMGGRLDATSAVPKDACAISKIGLDHQDFLGDTLKKISFEKGSIMRERVPCVSVPQPEEARGELVEIASKVGCVLQILEQPYAASPIGLLGAYQRWNAALAVETLSQLFPERELAIERGLQNVQLKGRFQIELAQAGHTIVLDGCHNEDAASELIKTWKEYFPSRSAHLVFGAAKDKNIKGILKRLLEIATSVEVYELSNSRSASQESLMRLVSSIRPELPVSSIRSLSEVKLGSHILVTGSLFLVGEWLEHRSSAFPRYT